MAERYDDEDQFESDEIEQDSDELDGEVIDLGRFNRQQSEALAKRIPIKLNGTVFKFLPPERWPLSVQSALDGGNDDASVHRWIRGVLVDQQAEQFIALDPDMELIGEVVRRLQERTLADRKDQDAKARRSGNPARRAQAGRGNESRPRRPSRS